MGVLRMQRQVDEVVQNEGGDGYFNFRKFRLHNNHLQSGKPTSPTCSMCVDGLASAVESLEEMGTHDGYVELDQGDGVNQGGDPAPSPSSGADSGESQLLGDERAVFN